MRCRVLFLLAVAPLAAACGSSSPKASTSTTVAASATTAKATGTTAAASATTVADATGSASTVKPITTLEEAKAALSEGGLVTSEQAGCVVDGLVVAIGKDAAIAVSNIDDLSTVAKPQQDAVVAAFEKCVPKSVFGGSIAADLVGTAQQQGVSVSATESACVAEKIMSVITVRDLLIDLGNKDFTSLSADKQAGVGSALAACLPPASLAKLTGAGGGGADAGGSPTTTG